MSELSFDVQRPSQPAEPYALLELAFDGSPELDELQKIALRARDSYALKSGIPDHLSNVFSMGAWMLKGMPSAEIPDREPEIDGTVEAEVTDVITLRSVLNIMESYLDSVSAQDVDLDQRS